MSQKLAAYFQTPSLFRSAIQRYEGEYINNPRRNWALVGPNGKFTAYTLSEQSFDTSCEVAARVAAASEMLNIVQSWNGDLVKPKEIQKYGDPSLIMAQLQDYGNDFRLGSLTLVDLTAEHYSKLVTYLESMSAIKSHSQYASIPISKFLHITNPSLFPTYDDTNIWYKLIAPESRKPAGVFSDDYIRFCEHLADRGLPLIVSMKPIDWTCKFNANYTYWARKHMAQASPELMPYFGKWFSQHVHGVPDQYGLRSYASKLYALAFEIVALGAGALEGAPSGTSN